MHILLILISIVVFVLITIPIFVKRFWELVAFLVLLQIVTLFLAPGDGGRWASLVLFLFGCVDCGIWLFRRELTSIVVQEDRHGMTTRFLLVLVPIAIPFVVTAITSFA